jgi:hypothetical protein
VKQQYLAIFEFTASQNTVQINVISKIACFWNLEHDFISFLSRLPFGKNLSIR